MSDRDLLVEVYAGEELFPLDGRAFYAKHQTVYVCDEFMQSRIFHTFEAQVTALATLPMGGLLLVATARKDGTFIEVVDGTNGDAVHSYVLPPDVGPAARMAVSPDGQALVLLTAYPIEALYLIRLNRMNDGLVLAQLDLTVYSPIVALSEEANASEEKISNWRALSFCPDDGGAIVCISKTIALLVLVQLTGNHCYLVARPIGQGFVQGAQGTNIDDFIEKNFISSLSFDVLHPLNPPEEASTDGFTVTTTLASPDGIWTAHSEEDVSKVLQNVFGQALPSADRDSASYLSLVERYCDLGYNSVSAPQGFSERVNIAYTDVFTHFYALPSVSATDWTETEQVLVGGRWGQKTSPRDFLRSRESRCLPAITAQTAFSFTGAHVWIPHRQACLLACRNLGLVAFFIPQRGRIDKANAERLLSSGVILFPPPPRTALVDMDFQFDNEDRDMHRWLELPELMLGLHDGLASNSIIYDLPHVPINDWYSGDRRLLSVSASFYREDGQMGADDNYIDRQDGRGGDSMSKLGILFICGFGDSTVRWYKYLLSDSDDDSGMQPLYAHTYLTLGPARYLHTLALKETSPYFTEKSPSQHQVCLAVTTEAIGYLPSFPIKEGTQANVSVIRPAVLHTVIPSLVFDGMNLRATHFRSLMNIRLMVEMQADVYKYTPTQAKVAYYALMKYHTGLLVNSPETIFRDFLRPPPQNPMHSCLINDRISTNPTLMLSDYVPLTTVLNLSGGKRAASVVRGSIATIPYGRLLSNSDAVYHCVFLGTLDTGRLYMMLHGDDKLLATNYFSCRLPLSILDTKWYIPDPITSLIAIPDLKFIITGHSSGYVRIFYCGFSNADSVSLRRRMLINLLHRIKVSELPITHLKFSTSYHQLVVLDAADNLFFFGGPQMEFVFCGMLQLKTQSYLSSLYEAINEGQGSDPFGYSAFSLHFQAYLLQKFNNLIIDGDSIATLLKYLDTAEALRGLELNQGRRAASCSIYLALTNATSNLHLDFLNQSVPTPAVPLTEDQKDNTKDVSRAAHGLLTAHQSTQVYSVPIRLASMEIDLDLPTSERMERPRGNDMKLMHALMNSFRPTYNPFIDPFVPLLYTTVTDLALTCEFIYVAFANGDILRLTYPDVDIGAIRSETSSIVLQADYAEALASSAERELDVLSGKYAKIVTDRLLLDPATMHPHVFRTSLPIKRLAVDPCAIPPPCSLCDILYVGLEDGRVQAYAGKHEVDQNMASRMAQYILETPLLGASGGDAIIKMSGPITSLSLIPEAGLLAVSDSRGATLVIPMPQLSSVYIKRVLAQVRDLQDISGPNVSQISATMVPAASDFICTTAGKTLDELDDVPHYLIRCFRSGEMNFSRLATNCSAVDSIGVGFADAQGNTLTYYNDHMSSFLTLLIANSAGSVILQQLPAQVVAGASQQIQAVNASLKNFAQLQASQDSLMLATASSKIFASWRVGMATRMRNRAGVMLLRDYQVAYRTYEQLIHALTATERVTDGPLWCTETSLTPPLSSHHPILLTQEAQALLQGSTTYNDMEQFLHFDELRHLASIANAHDAEVIGMASAAVQKAVSRMVAKVVLVNAPSHQDLSVRLAAQACALRFSNKLKEKSLEKTFEEVQKLRESCKELEADNMRVLTGNDLDVVYKNSTLQSLEALAKNKPVYGIGPGEHPSPFELSRTSTKVKSLTNLNRISSIKSMKEALSRITSRSTLSELDQLAQEEGKRIDVNKILLSSHRIPETTFRISNDVTVLARNYLFKHVSEVERMLRSSILRGFMYLSSLERILIHQSRQDEVGYAVCGLADPAVYIPSFPIPQTSESIMKKARKVCYLRSAQIASERYSIYAPQITLLKGLESSVKGKDNSVQLLFGLGAAPAGRNSVFIRKGTTDETGGEENAEQQLQKTLEYNPSTYYYKPDDPFFIVDSRVVISTSTDDEGGAATMELPTSQTLFSMLQLSTELSDRAPPVPYAQVTNSNVFGYVYPRLPPADILGSHDSLSLRRALFPESESAFVIRAKQQIILLRAIAILLMQDMNKKLAEERDRKYRIQSRIQELVTQLKDNGKEIIYIAKEETLLKLIEEQRARLFTELTDQGIGPEEAAARAAKAAVLNLPNEDYISNLVMENIDVQLLDVNTITGYSPDGATSGAKPCESLALMLGYNPYTGKQGTKEQSYSEYLTGALRQLAAPGPIEKIGTTVKDFLDTLTLEEAMHAVQRQGNEAEQRKFEESCLGLLDLNLRLAKFQDNTAVNSALLALTDEGLFRIEHLQTLIARMRKEERTKNNVTDREVLRLWYSYKRALYEMMRGAIDAANRVTVRDIPLPTSYGLDKCPGMKLSKEQEAEIEQYRARINELMDKRMKDRRNLEASCRTLREQAHELSLQFDAERLSGLRARRFNAELKLQAIQLAVSSMNLRILARHRQLDSEDVAARHVRGLVREATSLGQSETVLNALLDRLQQRMTILRTAEKVYLGGIKRELQDPGLLKYLRQRSNPKVTRNTIRTYFTSAPNIDHAIEGLRNTAEQRSGSFEAGMGTTYLSYASIQAINQGILAATDQQVAQVSKAYQEVLLANEDDALRWLAATHSLVGNKGDADFRDLLLESALADALFFETPTSSQPYPILIGDQDIPKMDLPALVSLPATENPLLVSIISRIIPLQSLPNISQLIGQVSSNANELTTFDVLRCTKLGLELQIYETTRFLQEVQTSLGSFKQEDTYYGTKVDESNHASLTLTRKNNTAFLDLPLVVLLTEGQIEGTRSWDAIVDTRPLVFGGVRVGLDIAKTEMRLGRQVSVDRPTDDFGADVDLDLAAEEQEDFILPDEASYAVLDKAYIDMLNDNIRALGERRSAVLMNLSRFRQKTKLVQHRIDILDWEKQDAVAQARDYQLIRLSKEMHEILRESTTTTEKRSREVNSVQRKLEHTRKTNILANNQIENRINAIPLEIKAIEQQNVALEARINELRAKNTQRRQAIPEADVDEVEVGSQAEADKKFRRIAALRKMKELSRAQEEELQFLMRELEKLRKRTYPSFD
ncbi:hypothetical protein GMRT_11255 [Giardia muris]|uniref:Uncharacterized protein n=1 Tax=Giardia muris TaxID=5742 RepID=A0A4Z1SR34_GIAMU|nr:hypothetical protein GMRT_11255 [Giardia muris]|eukprot:TNJ28316.1 hypothetical protein GMRT_11255 [Giardia muris]